MLTACYGVGDAVGNRAGLAGTCPSHHHDRSVNCLGNLSLLRIEPCQQLGWIGRGKVGVISREFATSV